MDLKDTSSNNQSLKIQLSLASLMFFSPFIQYLLKDADFELLPQEKNFVKGYITLGWLNILLFVVAILLGSFAYFYSSSSFLLVYQIILWSLIALIFGEIACVITETQLISAVDTTEHGFEEISYNKKHILLSYLPGYAIYLWYRDHNFDNPDLLLKESLLFWGIFTLSCFVSFPVLTIIIGFFILVRWVTLLGGIDIFPTSLSHKISSLFYKHPEEIWSFIRGFLVFIFRGNYQKEALVGAIENTKKDQYLYDLHHFGDIYVQYFLFLCGMGIVVRQVYIGNLSGIALFGLFLIFVRYGLMIYMIGHSPSLPLMREISRIFTPLVRYFTSKK